ncbi:MULTISPECIES: histidine kinase [unclassified Ensifer]|uniref:sensor histidine kinase n=1 Tax=unclassified Ensifer TaxID=2633371 RepID=UPI000ABBA5BA|nr:MULTISPECIES: histidine kinase [unclassified Ensifer]
MSSLDCGRKAEIEPTALPNNIIRNLVRSLGDWLLGAEPERLINIGRLVTAVFAIFAIYLDPTQPTSLLYESRVLLGFYILLSVLLVLRPLRKPLDSVVHLLFHVVDVVVLAWLTLLTNELTSPFFAVLPFVLLAMTMRWGLKGAAFGAFVLLLVQLVVGLPDLSDGDSELNLFIMRSTYFVLSAVILGYFGAYRERSRQHLAQLAEWPFEAVANDRTSWLGLLFRHGSRVLGGSRLFVVWRDQEDETGCVAYWANDHLKLVDVGRSDFWRRHDLQPPRRGDGLAALSRTEADLLLLIADLPEFSAVAGERIRRISAAYFSSVRYRGRVFVINSPRRPDEGSAMTEIIATRLGSELERLALTQRLTEAACSEERVRLACDLHDSVLQNLSAARLKLKLVGEAAGSYSKLPLEEVGSLILEQQQRIRHFVEDNRTAEVPVTNLLEQSLSGFANLLADQWNCQIAIAITPPGLTLQYWMVHEIKQLISETVANAVRHGRATLLRISIRQSDCGLQIELNDNGTGMQAPAKSPRPSSLSARVDKLGGALTVFRTAPGFGISISLPRLAGRL